ncbi:KAP P-loop domain-containing protein [Rhizobium etli bv. phaseoli str. IE4803]|nr:KAP P-loop domain-containing protein [Rhizobium etli bv. phaseoli str. IE4803]
MRPLFDFLRRVFDFSYEEPTINQEPDIGSDTPISSAKQDLLRRGPFARRIAAILGQLSLEEGRVFALRGPWGAGKSSLKNLIVEHLESNGSGAQWLDFNPWQWGDGDAISKALFEQIATKLDGPLSKASSRRAAILRRYGAILNGSGPSLKKLGTSSNIATFLSSASVLAIVTSIGVELPKVATIAAVLAAASIVVPFIGKALTFFGRDRWSEPLNEVRSLLEASLRKLKSPVVVFVDDIDRLEPDQIRILIRQIKANANLPNIVFMLLFQPSIVESALNPVSNGEGREFLKKIVQANFDLPPVPRSVVHKIMTDQLNGIADTHATPENGFDEIRWGNLLIGAIQPFINNLRDARRYISSVATNLPLHEGQHFLEVNIVDFLALEALRVFEPDIHGKLFEERTLVLQSSRFQGDRLDEEHKKQIEAMIAGVCERHRDTVADALKFLFPKLEWVFGGAHYSDDWQRSWIEAKRACSPRFFARYFELQTDANEISANEFNDFISISRNNAGLAAMISDIESRGLLESLAPMLDENVARLPTDAAATLLPAMFTIGQKLVHHSGTGFSSPWVNAWRAVHWYIDRIMPDDREALTLAAFRESKALSVAATIIHLNDPEAQRESSRFEPKLSAEAVRALKNEWLQQINARAGEGRQSLLHEPDLISYLYRWREYSGSSDEPSGWLERVTRTDDGLIEFLPHLVNSGSSHTAGDLVSSTTYRVEMPMITDFMDTTALERRLRGLDFGRLNSEQQRAHSFVLSAIEGDTEQRGEASAAMHRLMTS